MGSAGRRKVVDMVDGFPLHRADALERGGACIELVSVQVDHRVRRDLQIRAKPAEVAVRRKGCVRQDAHAAGKSGVLRNLHVERGGKIDTR